MKKLTTPRIFLVCLGEFARAILGGLLVTYALKFFNVTPSSGLPLLLPMGMIGLLRGIGVIFDAINDPWVASISDRLNNKNGRRIPLMRWFALPYALTALLIFFPPSGTVSTANIVWVAGMLLLYYAFSTLYLVPCHALQYELVSDTRRRVFFYTIHSLMYVLGSAVIFALPIIESSLTARGFAPIVSWRIALSVFAGIGFICAIIPSFSIKEKDYVSESRPAHQPMLASMRATFAYKNFTIMTIGFLVMQVAFNFFNTAMLFYIDTLLDLRSSFATVVLGISIVLSISCYPLLNRFTHKFGKKPLILSACFSYFFIYMAIFFFKSIADAIGTAPMTTGLLAAFAGPNATIGNVACAIALGVFIAFPIACTNILPSAAFADMAQYDTIKTGENKSAMFVAARQFVNKLAQAVVAVIISYVMYIGATDAYPTVWGVRLTALIAACTIAAAFFIFYLYDDKGVVEFINEHNSQI